MAKTAITKYGYDWLGGWSPLQMEMEAIKRGGRWPNSKGVMCGDGLLAHFLNARALIWPQRYCHRWTRLIYDEVFKNQIAIIMGSASSQKSGAMAEIALLAYWASPQNTCVLVSSTTREKLESAIFAEIKMLWLEGTLRHPWLAGNPIEYKLMITTDSLEEVKVRDFRRGIVGKACLPSGSLIDTPTGRKRIEDVKVGDRVFNAIGSGIVREVMSRCVERLVRITLKDGRKIDCTENHPILTQRGWVKSVDVCIFDRVFSVNETLQMLRWPAGKRLSEQEILLEQMQGSRSRKTVRFLSSPISSVGRKDGKVLQHDVCGALGLPENAYLSNKEAVFILQKATHSITQKPKVLLFAMSKFCNSSTVPDLRKTFPIYESFDREAEVNFLQSILRNEIQGATVHDEQDNPDSIRIASVDNLSTDGNVESLNLYRTPKKQRSSTLVQSGHCFSRVKISRGSGWRRSPNSESFEKRQRTRCHSFGTWVDSVEILNEKSDERYIESEGGYRVHNLEVEGHPSYSTNGIIVHNCYAGKNNYVGLGVFAGIKQENLWFLADELQFMAPTFLDCLPNMRSNANLKVIGSGNPDHNTESQLGIVAEPLEGWASVEDNEKTSVWPIRLSGGVCVNLIGTDSPNFDQDEDVYPRLIGHEFERTLRKDYGVNSPKYETQIKGRMKLSLAHSRVITRQLCRQHHAHDEAIWEGTNRTKIYAVDPAYGGGDRCVSMWGEFGLDDHGKTIFRLNPPRIIRINLKLPGSPEDQIADAMKSEMRELGIPATHAFYDSFGKGTVGFALSRKFGHECPVPINAGEQPTRRPVRADLYVTEETTHLKRLKRCDEHYSKFITEMWFSVRYAIEAEQIRELPEEVMLEGCWREYYEVAGGKIEVESKDEMRKRIGKSPDLMDCCAVLLEGARRHGFVIGSLGGEHDKDIPEGEDWLDIEAEKYKAVIKSKLIQHY